MTASVVRYAPGIVAGSALAGFGLSLGRDAYKKAKRYWPILLVLVCLAGVYFAGMWLFRNYRTLAGSIIKKIGALITLSFSCFGVYAGAAVAVFVFTPGVPAYREGIGDVPLDSVNVAISNLFSFPLLWIIIVQGMLFIAGAAVGIGHRRKRRLAWEAEEHNECFLTEHGLEVIDADEKGNLRLRDHSSTVGYRLMDDLELAGELEFMALGKRNKRSYLQYDGTGKYTNWTGLTDIR